MTIEEKRRDLFESVIESVIGFRLDKAVYAGGVLASQYQAPTMQAAWVGFNVALDAVVIELPEGCAWESLDSAMQFVCLTYEVGETGADPVELCRRNDCIKAIESTGLGLKVKS